MNKSCINCKYYDYGKCINKDFITNVTIIFTKNYIVENNILYNISNDEENSIGEINSLEINDPNDFYCSNWE